MFYKVLFHSPVLLKEVLTALQIQADGIYVDCTFGRGGHSRAILSQLNGKGRLLALDQDPEAVQVGQTLVDERFQIVHSSFTELSKQVIANEWQGKVNGILFDLGVSSPQLDDAKRGFSFLREGPLDMRMNPEQGEQLVTWLAKAKVEDIAYILKEYGEERFAKRIAQAIVSARQHTTLQTTTQLAKIIAEAHPAWETHKHPATRSFQAFRIFINRELEQLQQTLPQTVEILRPKGRLVVISFHSLEDRIVKRFMKREARGDNFPANVPVTVDKIQPRLRIVGKAQFATVEEVSGNPRARSAVLRVAERC